MIHRALFWKVLLDPACSFNLRSLKIVSGYAQPGMADFHMSRLRKQYEAWNVYQTCSICLVIGMPMLMERKEFEAYNREFRRLSETTPYGMSFECYYLCHGPRIHAKTYLWLDDQDNPEKAFSGSSNYTTSGFYPGIGNESSKSEQIEVMVEAKETDLDRVNQFFDDALSRSISCLDEHVEDKIRIDAHGHSGK